ncbi:MAG: hypothetical protein JST92_12065, partial [Deltaproteobacteria bacterium]|nr:hypothetical protein [Deltaproteobacteria bacterium]
MGLLLALTLAAAAAAPSAIPDVPADAKAASGALELYESWPLGTPLDHKSLRDAPDVWPEVIGRAQKTLDIGQFYVSNEPGQTAKSEKPTSLERTLRAIEAAAARGVAVRILVDKKFESASPENHESLERLAAVKGVQIRRIDYKAVAGGVMHAKYFIVDGAEACLGSNNFDWRSLSHIVELGVRVKDPVVAKALEDVFERDWTIAGGAKPAEAHTSKDGLTAKLGDAQVEFVASPEAETPAAGEFDLPKIVALIDGAKTSVRVQVLTYKAAKDFKELEDALVRAAARGVQVQLLVSHWSKRKGTVEGVQRLAAESKVQVKFFDTPEWSGGFIPYARTAHAKRLGVAGERAWAGTSNCGRGHFFDSR